jgi:excisionase family DNA binding protein
MVVSGSPVPSPSKWLTAEEGAQYLKTGVKVIYNAAARGELKVARIGGHRAIRTKVEWLDEYVESQIQAAK